MPTIICPQCRTENRPRRVSSLICENCLETIDPRVLADSAEGFVRSQQKLRRSSELPVLGQDEADELLMWALDLPPSDDAMDGEPHRSGARSPISSVSDPWRRMASAIRRRRQEWLYTDTVVRMSEDMLVINRYYWPLGRKRIRYSRIRHFTPRPLKAWHGQYRVHGIDHLGRWYSRDRHRGEKELAIDLTVGWLIRPVLTPDDVDTVLAILERKVGVG